MFLCLARLIAAQGFFGEIVAGGLVSPGPATAAHPFKLAGVALSLEFIIIA